MPSGEVFSIAAPVSSVARGSPAMTAEVMAVTVLPGATALTRIPLRDSSDATDFVKPTTACLAAV